MTIFLNLSTMYRFSAYCVTTRCSILLFTKEDDQKQKSAELLGNAEFPLKEFGNRRNEGGKQKCQQKGQQRHPEKAEKYVKQNAGDGEVKGDDKHPFIGLFWQKIHHKMHDPYCFLEVPYTVYEGAGEIYGTGNKNDISLTRYDIRSERNGYHRKKTSFNRSLSFLAYPKGFEPSTFRVGV